jgi:signal transduction histidine kinase
MNALDMYLMQIEILLVILVLLGAGLIGFASWWLAGQAMRPIGESYQQMQQFTADAAHELRTPLASLRAIVQAALRSESLTLDEAREALQILNRQSLRLSKLAQDLLILSQVDQAISTNSFICCCLNSIVQETVDEFMAMAMAANLTLAVELEYSPLYILGNPEQIHRAVSNLIGNAIQYTPKGKITVMLCRYQAMALIKVCDTGIGIAPEEQRHIFDRFYRVDQVRSRHKGGSGLGLAITKAIAQAHRGSLLVESQPNKGSVFTLALPLLDKPSLNQVLA